MVIAFRVGPGHELIARPLPSLRLDFWRRLIDDGQLLRKD